MALTDIDERTGPRKLLALDGGGIRGLMTVEILGRLEGTLREERIKAGIPSPSEKFVLADYFDYVAGTSTGAILAAGISRGLSVTELRKFYLQSGREMFDKASLLKRHKYKYEDAALTAKLKQVFGGAPLGSEELRTYLLMILRNASTDSPWPISNNPRAKYNDRARHNCNLDIPLWQLVRASTAAPTYFPPEVFQVKPGVEHVFVDGGVTMYNNPAFQLYLMATLAPYRLEWPSGEQQMLIVSIGTGQAASANLDLGPSDMNLIYNATAIPSALMFAALNEQDLLCRVFERCLVGHQLDRELGDLIGVANPGGAKHFTYLRYNAELSQEGLDDLGLSSIQPDQVSALDSVEGMDQLQELGQAVGQRLINPEHFEPFLGGRPTEVP